jgi:DNA excision repair protein ERCC-4
MLQELKRQSGFCKAFSDEPEAFAHGMSPLKDMLVNLNMNNVMVWPRSALQLRRYQNTNQLTIQV